MQEWLNWPAWKVGKPQKGFGGSNPPFSAKTFFERGDFSNRLVFFVFASEGEFVQSVAPRTTNLRVTVVC